MSKWKTIENSYMANISNPKTHRNFGALRSKSISMWDGEKKEQERSRRRARKGCGVEKTYDGLTGKIEVRTDNIDLETITPASTRTVTSSSAFPDEHFIHEESGQGLNSMLYMPKPSVSVVATLSLDKDILMSELRTCYTFLKRNPVHLSIATVSMIFQMS
jgi:hypothetical protein